MDREQLRKLVAQGAVLCDGGMGTTFVAHGVAPDACFDALNLTDPDVVRAAHRGFVEAGARLIEANTFGANRYKLAPHGLGDRVAEVNAAGARLAREAGAEVVAGSVGPLGVRLAPYGRVRPVDARAAYAEQIAALAEAGVDLILIETQTDLAEVEQAVLAARETCALPVIASMTFTRDDRTLFGESAEVVAERLASFDVDGVGANCSEGPAQVLRLVSQMRGHAGDRPLSAMPNAGGPQRHGGRFLYRATPEYFAEHAVAFAEAGAALIGGCCGTSPEHVRAMGEALSRPQAPAVARVVHGPAEHVQVGAAAPAPSNLARALGAGAFVVTVEMDPPRGVSAARLVAGAETLREAGADAINVADSPMARMRMSPWAACHLIQQEAEIETVLHFPTRGRNLLRIQGDLLAAHALGVRNIFAVMGDPTSIGDHPEAADRADLTPSGLIALIKGSLNAGSDRTGASIGDPTHFVVGCAVNLNAADLEREARVLHRKVSAGADFALSQAVFAAERLHAFLRVYEARYGELRLPILAGILPLVTRRHAEFLHNEVPGIDIPEEVRERMGAAGDRAEREGLRMAVELSARLGERAAGIYLIPPFGRYDLAAELIEEARGAQALDAGR